MLVLVLKSARNKCGLTWWSYSDADAATFFLVLSQASMNASLMKEHVDAKGCQWKRRLLCQMILTAVAEEKSLHVIKQIFGAVLFTAVRFLILQ